MILLDTKLLTRMTRLRDPQSAGSLSCQWNRHDASLRPTEHGVASPLVAS
jgi:hypothetical protein